MQLQVLTMFLGIMNIDIFSFHFYSFFCKQKIYAFELD